MANSDYGAILLTTAESVSQALKKRLEVSSGFKPSEWAENINQLVKPAVHTASGNVCHFTDGLDLPLVSLKTAITAVQSGSGTPSPSNPRPISGFSAVNVNRTGKNIIGTLAKTGTTINTSGDEVSNVNFDCSDYLFFPSGTYSVSFEDYVDNSSSSAKIRIGAYDFDKTFISPLKINHSSTATIGAITELSFTLTTDCFIKVAFNKSRCKNLQIEYERSTTATAYEPYNGISVNIPLGRDVFGGNLNVTTGVLEITHGYLQPTSVISVSSNGAWIVTRTLGALNNSIPISSHFEGIPQQLVSGACYVTGSGDILVAVPTDQTLNTKALADAWCAENKPQFVYPLATPITIQLTPTEISALLGVNNIWGDTGASEVVYKALPS